jgi:hypothetical protein
MRAFMTFWLTALLAFFAQTEFTYDPVTAEIVEARLKDAPYKNQDRHGKLEELFTSVNCIGDQIQRQTIKYSNSPNLICTLPGETSSVIVLENTSMPLLHTGRDRIDRINLEEHYKTYRLVLAYLTFLDGQLP